MFSGGEDTSRNTEIQLLRDRKHNVVSFEEDNNRIPKLSRLGLLRRTFWSQESYDQVRDLLKKINGDILYVENYLPLLSPAVYYAAASLNVAVIQRLQNYRQLCPKGTLLRDGKICEECIHKKIKWPSVRYGCYRNSRLTTASVAGMLFYHQTKGTWQKKVDRYIATTSFSRDKLIEGGLPAEKISIKPNFIYPDPKPSTSTERKGALFIGRLYPEKGIDDLLKAWRGLKHPTHLTIAGDGILADQVKEACRQNPNIQYLGLIDRETIFDLLKKVQFLVFPSIWYEGQPLTILEAFATGTPVIAHDLGAMSSLIKPNINGLHTAAPTADALVETINWATTHKEEMLAMGHGARADYEKNYSADVNYTCLVNIFSEAIHHRKTNAS